MTAVANLPGNGLRILSVIRSVNRVHGGPAEGVRQLARAVAGLGHHYEVATLDAPGEPWLQDFPVPLHALGPAHLNYGWSPRLRPWLHAHAGNFDAVIVHGLWQYQSLGTWLALRKSRVPFYMFFHGMLDPWFRREYPLKHLKKWLYWVAAERRVVRDAAAVCFTAQEEARLAPLSFRPYRARHAVVGYGLALDETARSVDAEAFLKAFPACRGRRLVLFMARIHPKKGCDLLIDAFADAAAGQPDLHLVMAGPDQVGWQQALQRRAQALGVAARITWCGMLSGELKWSAYKAAEVFALPSHQENFGIAVAEALALGRPVLISEQVNIWREIVAAGAGLAAADDLPGTRSLLQRWLALDEDGRAAMRERAAACYRAHFDVAAAAQNLVRVIRGQDGSLQAPNDEPARRVPIHAHET